MGCASPSNEKLKGEQMVYIVYLTSGSYSDYQLNSTLLGDSDPLPILDSFVRQESNGLWNTYKSMKDYEHIILEPCYGPNPYPKKLTDQGIERCALRDTILRKLPQVLKDNGFKETEALELWMD